MLNTFNLILASLLLSFQVSADPTSFRAVYKADYKGLPVSAVGIRELQRLDENTYQLLSSAKSIFASVTEQSTFTLKDNQVVPLHYQYSRTGIGKKKKVNLSFDWQREKASDDTPEKSWEIDIPPGTMDKLLYQFQMRNDLAYAREHQESWPDMSYQIADNGRLKVYDFQVVGEEQIKTPIGNINTVKVIRVRKDNDRKTTIWMAPGYEFLLIRLQQIESDGSGLELLLKEAQFNGIQIAGS